MTPPVAHVVASRVSRLMSSQDVSTKALAEATGISRMTLTRRLTGNSGFTINELDAIASFFNTTPAALITSKAA